MCRTIWIAAALAVFAAGCSVKTPPDPNDVAKVGIMQPQVLQRNLKWASEMVNERVEKNEISDKEGQKYLTQYANSLVDKIDFKQMQPQQAWQYAEIFRTAHRWDEAKTALELAVEHARKVKNQDRRVNDSLRLAQALAELGQRKEAIQMTRSVFDTRERDKAPILLSVVYEIAPALRGHGMDIETAKLVEDAIDQHMQVVIDPNTDAGRAFLVAKWHHIRKAWELVLELYRESGREDLADKARAKAAEMMDRQGRV